MSRSRSNTRSVLLALSVACAVAPSADEAVVLYYGTRARAFVATPEAARAAMLEAFDELELAIVEAAPNRLVARSPGTTRFFALVGEQTKWHEVTAELAAASDGRVRIDLDAVLVHGPAGGADPARLPESDAELYDDLFELIHAALRARTTPVE